MASLAQCLHKTLRINQTLVLAEHWVLVWLVPSHWVGQQSRGYGVELRLLVAWLLVQLLVNLLRVQHWEEQRLQLKLLLTKGVCLPRKSLLRMLVLVLCLVVL